MNETADRPALTTCNPATLEPGRRYPGHSLEDAKLTVTRAAQAQRRWRDVGLADRAGPMRKAAEVLRSRRDELAALMTEEMGKPVTDGRGEVDKCAAACEHFAENAGRYLAREPAEIEGAKAAFVTFNPVGVVLAVMPWNFPFWQVFRFAAPALMAGNGGILKHATNVPGCALAIESVLREAGFPERLFGTVLVPSAMVEALIEHPDIAAVTLTGSVAAGRSVAPHGRRRAEEVRARARRVRRLHRPRGRRHRRRREGLRGGPHGQRRPELHRRQALHRRPRGARGVRGRVGQGHACLRPGRPARPGDEARAAAERRCRDEVHAQVEASVAAGAKLLLGGVVPDRPGAWYPATVLTGVRQGQPAHDDEVFGPVAAIIEAGDEQEAIAIANASEFGLGSGVLTRDLARGERIAAEALDAGLAFVNDNVRSDPRLPFGGVKHSGYGRECAGYGIREFVNIKSVQVKA